MNDGLMSIREVAEEIGVTPRTVYDHIHKGFLNVVRIGRDGWMFVRREDFDVYVRTRLRRGLSDELLEQFNLTSM